MNQKTFNKALGSLDEKMLEEHIRYGKKLKKRRTATRIAAAAASFVMILSLSIGVFTRAGSPVDVITDPVENVDSGNEFDNSGNDENVEYIHFGINEEKEPIDCSSMCCLDCRSFFKFGETMVIDVYYGDAYSRNTTEDYNGASPGYNYYGVYGYPIFEIYDGNLGDDLGREPYRHSEFKKTDSNLYVNGVQGIYKIEYTEEEMHELDVSSALKEYWEAGTDEFVRSGVLHHETVNIDFSRAKPGENGVIVVRFGWFFTALPEHHHRLGFHGTEYTLHYYVKENGIFLSKYNFYRTNDDLSTALDEEKLSKITEKNDEKIQYDLVGDC